MLLTDFLVCSDTYTLHNNWCAEIYVCQHERENVCVALVCVRGWLRSVANRRPHMLHSVNSSDTASPVSMSTPYASDDDDDDDDDEFLLLLL